MVAEGIAPLSRGVGGQGRPPQQRACEKESGVEIASTNAVRKFMSASRKRDSESISKPAKRLQFGNEERPLLSRRARSRGCLTSKGHF